jgi:hypothetical protein
LKHLKFWLVFKLHGDKIENTILCENAQLLVDGERNVLGAGNGLLQLVQTSLWVIIKLCEWFFVLQYI